MDDIQELIGKIMSDPQAMSQLESMGKQLGLDIPNNNSGNNPGQNHSENNNQGGSFPQINQVLFSGLLNNTQLLSLLG